MPEQRLDDFGGGFSDFTVNGPATMAELLDNLVITKNRKLEPRPGSDQMVFDFEGFTFWNLNAIIYSTHSLPAIAAITVPQIPNGQQIINKVFVWQNYLFCITGTSLYYLQTYYAYDSSGNLFPPSNAWTEVTGVIDTNHSVSLAKLPLHNLATFSTRYEVTDLGSRILITSSDGMPPKYLYFPISSGSLLGGAPPVPTIIEAGLPRPEISGVPNYEQCIGSNGPTVAPEGASTSTPGFSYLYAFCLRFNYQTHDGTAFVMRGPPLFLSFSLYWTSAIAAGAGNGTKLSYMPVYTQDARHPLAPGAPLEVYRTKNAQQTYYYVEDINPTTSDTISTFYYDRTPDTSLGTQTLYTTGGFLGRDPAPNAKFHTLANSLVWYGGSQNGISATASYSPTILTQCLPGGGDAAPEANTLKLETAMTGLSRIDTYPVAFEQGKCWRIEGSYGVDGSGSAYKRAISETVGCIAADGIINLGRMILFPSETGIYMTDGFSATPLSMHISRTYRQWTKDAYQRAFLFGRYLPRRNLCIWAFCPESSDTHSGFAASNSPTELLVLHLDQGLDGGGKFTTWSCGTQAGNFSATDLAEIAGDIVRADRRGYLLCHQDQMVTDLYFNPGTGNPSGSTPIIWDWRTGHMSHGTDFARKWLTKTEVTTSAVSVADSVDWGAATIPSATSAVMAAGGFWPAWSVGYYVSFANDNYQNWVKITALSTDLTTITVASDALVTKNLTTTATGQGWRMKIGNGAMLMDLYTARDKSGDYRAMKHVHHDPVGSLHADWRRTPAGVIRRIYTQLRITNEEAAAYSASARMVIEALTFHYEGLQAGLTAFQAGDT